MKTFKQFIEALKKPIKIEAPKKPKKVKKGPSTTPETDSMKIKHDSQRDAHADRSRLDKEKQSTDFKRMVSTQRGELERAKKSDKSTRLRKTAADKRKKQQAKKK